MFSIAPRSQAVALGSGTDRTIEAEQSGFNRGKTGFTDSARKAAAVEPILPADVSLVTDRALALAELQREIDGFLQATLNPLFDD